MNKRKMSMIGIAVLLVVMLLAACGKNKEEASSPKAAETKASKPAASASDATPSAADTGTGTKLTGDFEIQYFVGGYGDKWWKKVIADFRTANPELNVIESGGPQINDQMKPRWIGGNPPDFVYIDGAGLNDRQMVEDGQLEDLTEWFKTANNVDGELISDILAQAPQAYDGKVYNIPLVLNSWGIFWDKALFKEKGWAEPQNFDEFMGISQTIKDAGINPFIHTGMYPYYINGAFLFPTIVSENNDDPGILQDMAANKVEAFQQPAVLAALNKIVNIRDSGFIDKASVQINHTNSQMLFLQHKDAFIPNGLWLPNEMSKDIPSGFEFGFIPSLGQDAGRKVVANTSTATVAIAAKGKNKEAAKAFLQFIFAKAQASQWAELSGAPSNIKGDISSSNAPSYVKDAAKFLTDASTVVIPTITYNADVDKVMMDATLALTIGKIAPEEWVKRVTDVVAKVK